MLFTSAHGGNSSATIHECSVMQGPLAEGLKYEMNLQRLRPVVTDHRPALGCTVDMVRTERVRGHRRSRGLFQVGVR